MHFVPVIHDIDPVWGSVVAAIGTLLVVAFCATAFLLIMFKSEKMTKRRVLLVGAFVAAAFGSFILQQWGLGQTRIDPPLGPVIESTYGVETTAENRRDLLGDQSSTAFLLTDPDPSRLVILGETLLLIDDEPHRLTLAGVDGEWVLLDGNPADLTELDRK